MVKFVIAFMVVFQVLFSYGGERGVGEEDSLTFVQIGNIKYDAGQLYLNFSIYSFYPKEWIEKEYELPKQDAVDFLKLVNELDLTNIRSIEHKGICDGCSFFGMDYIRGGRKQRIGIVRYDMNPDEREKYRSYRKGIDSMVNYWQDVFRAELPDGQYSQKGTRYSKEYGQWFDLSKTPLIYIRDGVEIDALSSDELLQFFKKNKNYQMTVLQGPSAVDIYGSRGYRGVIVLSKKRKKGLSKFLPWRK